MNRILVSAVAGAALLAATACTTDSRGSADGHGSTDGRGSPVKSSAPAATTRPASPQDTAAARDKVIEAARTHLLAHTNAADLPGPAGLVTDTAGPSSALFVWVTADRRFCSAGAAADGGFLAQTCVPSRYAVPARSARPGLVELLTAQWVGGENHVFGTDHETVRSVTCNGEPVPFRELAPLLGGGRRLYAFDLPGPTTAHSGRVTVTVVRAHTTATEHVNMIWKRRKGQSRPTCA
ncbi:hypothetical protein ACGFYV_13620 [Streptomyces sp. NPDC048297]|uniref:hypothetical protein n=1 Tax=Streptomyces sp. NPDC048297 TaxID=3365531 RepID=UPI00372198FF